MVESRYGDVRRFPLAEGRADYELRWQRAKKCKNCSPRRRNKGGCFCSWDATLNWRSYSRVRHAVRQATIPLEWSGRNDGAAGDCPSRQRQPRPTADGSWGNGRSKDTSGRARDGRGQWCESGCREERRFVCNQTVARAVTWLCLYFGRLVACSGVRAKGREADEGEKKEEKKEKREKERSSLAIGRFLYLGLR